MITKSGGNAKPELKANTASRHYCWSSACLCQSGFKSPSYKRITSRRQSQRGNAAEDGAGRKGNGEHPSAAWVLPVTPEETCGETQGYLKGLLCFEGEDVVNLFLPPDAVEEGVADDSGAGEARVEVESDLVSGLTKQINFKPKTVREKGWRAVNDASGPGEQESWEQSMSLHA